MAYVISDDCVSCGACAEVCPAEAISEGDGKYVIDADACLDCGTCEAECPNGAIKFIDWKDIADEVIAQGIVRTATLA